MLTNLVATFLICPLLIWLFSLNVGSNKLSWIVHGTFAFLLAILIYGAYLRTNHTYAYGLFFIALASGWEIYEFFILGQRVDDSFILTMIDTIMDMAFGFVGTCVAMALVKFVKNHLSS